MTGFASKRQAAWNKFADPWNGMAGWGNELAKSMNANDKKIDLGKYAGTYGGYITALAEQPAQEPVAWMRPSDEGYDSAFRDHSTVVVCTGNPWTGWIPLYTTPPQRPWVGLTREEILHLYHEFVDFLESDDLEYEKAIEAKLKEKNS